jgi:uncharacterized protein
LYLGANNIKHESIVRYVKKFIDIFNYKVSSLIFFGGEPLLSFKEIKKALNELLDFFDKRQGDIPSLAIVTNGSLINKDIADFFVNNNFFVTVSLDGPKIIHDRCRPFKGGDGSYEKVIEGINELARAGVFYTLEATYTSHHLKNKISVVDVIDHLLQLKAEEIHVLPAFPEQVSGIKTYQNSHVASLFKSAAERAAKHYLESNVTELSYVSRLCYAFGHNLKRKYICTAGIDKFTIMTNGDIVPCYLICDSKNCISSCEDSKKNHEKDVDYRMFAKKNLAECSRCWASDWCFSCYGPGYARKKELGAPHGLECEIYKSMIEATFFECASFLRKKQNLEKQQQTSVY